MKFKQQRKKQFGGRTLSLCFTDQEAQEEILQGGTSSLVGQFLHPISLELSSRSIQRIQTVQLVLNRILILYQQFGCRTSLCFTDQELRKRFCWVDQPLCRSGLTPISCTKFKIHSAHADSPIGPKPNSYFVPAIWM